MEGSQKFDMPSGAALYVTVAPFTDAWALMRASLKTLKGTSLKPEELRKEMCELIESPSLFTAILDRIVEFATSAEVDSAIWRCAQRALYIPAGSDPAFPGHKVNMALLDDPTHGITAREDFAIIIKSLLEVNCKPFLARALSGLLKVKVPSAAGQPLG